MKDGQPVGFTVNAYPNRTFERQRAHGAPRRADGAERRDLHRRDRRREPGSGAPARHDREPSDRHRRAPRTCCASPTRRFASDLPASPSATSEPTPAATAVGRSAAPDAEPAIAPGADAGTERHRADARVYRGSGRSGESAGRCAVRLGVDPDGSLHGRSLRRRSAGRRAPIIVGDAPRADVAATDAGTSPSGERAARAAPRACSEDRAVALIETRDLTRVYDLDAGRVVALDGVSLDIEPGRFRRRDGSVGLRQVDLHEPVGCLDRPDRRAVSPCRHRGREPRRGRPRARLRNREIGFVFQQFNLLPRIDALGNVELPMIYAGVDRKHPPRARPAGARARRPRGPRASPPDAALRRPAAARRHRAGARQQPEPAARRRADRRARQPHRATEILALFQELNREGATIVLVTHDADVGRHARRLVRFKDGRVIEDHAPEPPMRCAAIVATEAAE